MKYRYKKSVLLIVLSILLPLSLVTCDFSGKSVRETNLHGTEKKKVFKITIPDNIDPGLFLYRKDETKDLVVDFYTRVTGSADIARAILKYSDLRDIPLSLSFALAWTESRYNAKAVNFNKSSVDRGLFQLNSRTFRFLKKEDFFNPEINAKYGTAHLRFCLDRGENEIVALAMYNAGTVGVKTGTPYSTLKYVAQVEEYKDYLDTRFRREVLGESSLVLSTFVSDDS